MWCIKLLTAYLLFENTVWSLPYFEKNVTDDLSLLAEPLSRRSVSNGVQLRILCLGASIVNGYPSASGNGFRYALRNQLVYSGNPVNMIGSLKAGNMADNDVEGHGGIVINDAFAKADLSIPSQPNLVLIHVGSNDMTADNDVGNAHVRLGALVDHLFEKIPGVTIIASTLLPRGDATINQRTQVLNSNIPGMVQSRQKAGKKITYVDFSSSWFSPSDLVDGLHPNDYAYTKMAAVWYQGIVVANNAGWITAPANVPGVSDAIAVGSSSVCDKVPGNILGPYQVQFGSGTNYGPYVHTGTSVSTIRGFNNPPGSTFNNPFPEGVYWVDINGDGIDDYVYVPNFSIDGLGVALSLGNGNLGEYLYIPFRINCLRRGIRFADFTGDGRDDFCCLEPNGDLTCWQNTPGPDARSPVWVPMGKIMVNKGYPQANVRLADVDGDGRADYICVNATGGVIWGWRNVATSKVPPQSWTPFGGVASGLPVLELSGWDFADLNGDHKDDLVWIDVNGRVTTWINQRGFRAGNTPVWQSMGVTHGGGSSPRQIKFGAFMGSGRADYSNLINPNPDLGNVIIERVRNDDHGGQRVKADGNKYCDMTGDGFDDYVWVSITGELTLYGNINSWGHWSQWGVIYNVNRARRDIHLADFDGDGKCDILIVEKNTGETTMIRNDFANGRFAFTNIGVVTGGATCTEGYGYGLHDVGVHWNDITGDGRADFSCMSSNGAITGYLNKGVGNMVWQGQIKHTEGKERNNLRIADVDGDGRDDLVLIDPFTGLMEAWKNNGQSSSPIPAADPNSAFSWISKGEISHGGNYRGSAIEMPSLGGLGRADNLAINPQTNEAWVLLSICSGSGGLDPVIPNLPSGAPPAPSIIPPTSGSPGGIFYLPPPSPNLCTSIENYDSASTWSVSQAGLALDYTTSQQLLDPENAGKTHIGGIDAVISQYTKISVTNCESVTDSASCNVPTSCPTNQDFVPYYYLQKAFANFHSFLNQFSHALETSLVLGTNNIDALINEFALPIRNEVVDRTKFMAGFGAVLGILSPALSLYPNPLGSALAGVTGGALAFAASSQVPPEDKTLDYVLQTSAALKERAEMAFKLHRDSLTSLAQAIFKSGDLSRINPEALNIYDPINDEYWGYKNNITKFFADGRFAKPVPDFTLIQDELTKQFKAYLLGIILVSSRVYILKNPYVTEPFTICSENGGFVMTVNGEDACYTMESPGSGADTTGKALARDQLSKTLTREQTYDIMSVKYGVVFNSVIISSVNCQNARKSYGGGSNFRQADDIAKDYYPLCFFNLPVLTVKPDPDERNIRGTTPCYLAAFQKDNTTGTVGIDYLPDYLAKVFTRPFCNTICGVRPQGCQILPWTT